jgi:S1-C subfamily serine protease
VAPRRPDAKYLLVLSTASVVILVGGWLVRPSSTPEAPVALLTEADLSQLARLAERRSLDGTAEYFAGVAHDVQPSIVRVTDLHASGIVWEPDRLVTVRLPVSRPPSPVGVHLDADKRLTDATRWGPNLPLATLAVRDRPAWTPVTRAAQLPKAGEWVVAVWRTGEGAVFAPGSYVERAPLHCWLPSAHEIATTVPLLPTMAGGGLFDLDGRLLAVILPCGERLAALAVASVAELLSRAATIEQQIHARFGLVVSRPPPEAAGYFAEADAVIVREVRPQQTGDDAGFIAGDWIVAVNGSAVSGVDDLAPALTVAVEITVRRARREIDLAVPPTAGSAERDAAASDLGLMWEPAPRGFAIDDVAAESRAARAGLRPGDRIVRVDYAEPRSLDDLRRRLRARETATVLIEIERDSRRIALWLPPENARE